MPELPLRPRSARAHETALAAARALLAEGGLPAATVDAISARSGVSKATLYKHWPSRTALAAEAFGREMADAIPLPDTGDPRADVVEQVRRVSAFYAGPAGTVFAQLLAACVTDPEAATYFRRYFLDGRRAAISVLWQRVTAAGLSSVDTDTATDLLFGPLIFRRLTGHAPLTVAEADAISSAALEGLLKQG
ncbi:TetR/AcrR family transcriptional regulator [Amycolatopsis sp. FDAARGOS 1241]|uniref:TetR/AcrR family transcriptional regulator n=1 Tax=Amycolatopsis sp. FDAARGOS 1241 TaxID=2778070 RepID=UPI00194EFC74|nr:TetR/AcrR family transcriptional regulator [Amycolatopsis sp. FDAARGOS 1241]QRP48387.1 TetR/AcrR family transcriptional regulator [Amycolatopsis sp. FDAARGOS 1241]